METGCRKPVRKVALGDYPWPGVKPDSSAGPHSALADAGRFCFLG
jgi:hypothetical protein